MMKNMCLIVLVLTVVIAIYKDNLEILIKSVLLSSTINPISTKVVYTLEELSEYNGILKKSLYLAFMGSIFDVSESAKHYGKGAPYNYFVGKDGSRAFISGNFLDESENKDHVLDFSCDELLTLLNWKKTLKDKYIYVGVVIGRYFNHGGKDTEYQKQLNDKIKHCYQAKEMAKNEDRRYPPCNIEWNAETSTRVWCTKSSGGVSRSWAGVPRQLYTPGQDNPRCVCVNIHNNEIETGLLKEYDDCLGASTSCNIKK